MPFLDLIPYAMIPIVIIVVVKLIIHLRQNRDSDDSYPFYGELDVLAKSCGFKVEASVKSGVTGFVCNDCGFKVKRGNNEGTEVQLHYRTHHEK